MPLDKELDSNPQYAQYRERCMSNEDPEKFLSWIGKNREDYDGPIYVSVDSRELPEGIPVDKITYLTELLLAKKGLERFVCLTNLDHCQHSTMDRSGKPYFWLIIKANGWIPKQ